MSSPEDTTNNPDLKSFDLDSNDLRYLLIRIDERTRRMEKDMASIKESYARKEELLIIKNDIRPIKQIVYGMVSLILVTVMGSLIALVVNK